MDLNSKAGTQLVGIDDSNCGEGLAIFFTHDGDSECRWRVLVKAIIDQGIYDMGEFFVSPPVVTTTLPVPTNAPPGRLSRMVGAAICPGAVGWSLEVSAVPRFQIGTNNEPDEFILEEETASIVLASSSCYSSPVGVSRVGERYGYIAGTAITPTAVSYVVLAGQKITGIACIGLTGGGSFTIDGGSTMLVNDGISVNFEPEAPIPANAVIVFNNVIFAIEFLESA